MQSKEYLLRFIIVGGSSLAMVMALSYHFFPRRSLTSWNTPGALVHEHAREKNWFRRLFDPGRSFPPADPFWSQRQDRHRDVAAWRPVRGMTGNGATPALSQAQVALRETVLSQLILCDRYGTTQEQAWDVIREADSGERYRSYEEQRFLNEMLWMQYQDNRTDRSPLSQLQVTANEVVANERPNFEDYYYAGIAHLLNGDEEAAYPFLQHAMDRWPAQGRALGSVYFALLVCHAARGDESVFLDLLRTFRDIYPDWLYVEMYLPDLDDLQTIYPHATLLLVLRGRTAQWVNDYASANAQYQLALAANPLSQGTTALIDEWRRETEATLNP